MKTMTTAPTDDQWVRRALALLERSAGAFSLTPAPTRSALRAFADLGGGLAERCPAWLRPWPVMAVETAVAGDGVIAAVSIERAGARLVARESAPAPDRYGVVVVLEYYLHLVHDHVRACRLLARRPGGVAALLPAEEAHLAEAFEEIEQALAGGADPERLGIVREALAAPA